MALQTKLEEKLGKIYEPSSRIRLSREIITEFVHRAAYIGHRA